MKVQTKQKVNAKLDESAKSEICQILLAKELNEEAEKEIIAGSLAFIKDDKVDADYRKDICQALLAKKLNEEAEKEVITVLLDFIKDETLLYDIYSRLRNKKQEIK